MVTQRRKLLAMIGALLALLVLLTLNTPAQAQVTCSEQTITIACMEMDSEGFISRDAIQVNAQGEVHLNPTFRVFPQPQGGDSFRIQNRSDGYVVWLFDPDSFPRQEAFSEGFSQLAAMGVEDTDDTSYAKPILFIVAAVILVIAAVWLVGSVARRLPKIPKVRRR